MSSIFSKAKELLFGPMMLDDDFRDYDEYWEKRGFHAPSLRRAQRLTKMIDNGSTLLDIGCGDGTVIDYLSKHNRLKSAEGIDISKRAVSHVQKKGYKAKVVDITSPEFNRFLRNKNYDYVVITEVLEHIYNPENVVKLLYGHVNKALFVSVPNTGFFLHRLRLLFGRFPMVTIQQHVKEHIRFWTMKDFIYWAEYHNYKVDKVVDISGMRIGPFKILERKMPGMFAPQILYKMIKNENK